ncbi:MAG: peptidoglycan bridge formation glycyltransferase FemA/FemB family protein, partial [Candidatus Dormibacteraeota bacterium]|nr:peptidoglycan bridge formation glycyltransferase FemA/FemB family protein [Candidatus Dormibacteraeota bacterium]
AWDAALAATSNPHLLQSWRWGALQSRFGWTVERRQLDLGGQDVPLSLLCTAALVPGRRWGYVPRGPAVNGDRAPAAIEAIAAWARELGLAFVRVEPELEEGWRPPAGWLPATATQPEHTSIIDIARPDEELMASFKSKTRYNIRLAQRKGVEVAAGEEIATFARLAAETSARHRIQLAPEKYYRELHRLMSPDGMSRLYIATHQGIPLAGIMVVRFAGRATYLFGASTRQGREKMPAYLLHWQAMRDLRDAGDREYDLWGVPPDDRPGHPWAGLWQFKSGWQGRLVSYAGAFDLPVSAAGWRAHNALANLRQVVRGMRSRLSAG